MHETHYDVRVRQIPTTIWRYFVDQAGDGANNERCARPSPLTPVCVSADGRSYFRGDSTISKAKFDEAMARTSESLPRWVAVANFTKSNGLVALSRRRVSPEGYQRPKCPSSWQNRPNRVLAQSGTLRGGETALKGAAISATDALAPDAARGSQRPNRCREAITCADMQRSF
jgi:hypothetical protein